MSFQCAFAIAIVMSSLPTLTVRAQTVGAELRQWPTSDSVPYGSKVVITDRSGKIAKGVLANIGGDTIAINVDGTVATIAKTSVSRIGVIRSATVSRRVRT